jgi:beta-lactamase class A
MSLTRRGFLTGASAFASAACASTRAPLDRAPSEPFERLERAHGGRFGVVVVDLASGRRLAWRAEERFPMCSTFKTVLVGAVLTEVDAGRASLDEPLPFGPRDLLAYAPAVSRNVGRGAMTIAELCEATVTVSDNTAANLLLRRLGGCAAVNACLRRLGDEVTRLDRLEPDVNEAAPGDPRDTTSPGAMAETLRLLFTGDALSSMSRARIVAWHRATVTGPARLRAGLPATWVLAHKTGTGDHGATNDIGVAWPPAVAPVIVTAYSVGGTEALAARERALAEIGRIAASFVARS